MRKSFYITLTLAIITMGVLVYANTSVKQKKNPRLILGTTTSCYGVSGCTAWYKADSLSLNNSDPVATWADSAVNGWDLTAAGAARPTYLTNQINSLPAVSFDGSANGIVNSSFTLNQKDTVIFVWYYKNASAAFGYVWSSGTGFQGVYTTGSGGNNYSLYAGDTNNQSLTTQSWQITATVADGANGAMFKNGTSIVSYNFGANNATGGIGLGNRYAMDLPVPVEIAEILFFDSTMDATARANVEKCLSDKYGIAVAGGTCQATPVSGKPAQVPALPAFIFIQ